MLLYVIGLFSRNGQNLLNMHINVDYGQNVEFPGGYVEMFTRRCFPPGSHIRGDGHVWLARSPIRQLIPMSCVVLAPGCRPVVTRVPR